MLNLQTYIFIISGLAGHTKVNIFYLIQQIFLTIQQKVSPLLLSSRPESSPPFPVTAGPHLRSPRHPAAPPGPAVSQSLRSAREHVRPYSNRWKRHNNELWAVKISFLIRHWCSMGINYVWRPDDNLNDNCQQCVCHLCCHFCADLILRLG